MSLRRIEDLSNIVPSNYNMLSGLNVWIEKPYSNNNPRYPKFDSYRLELSSLVTNLSDDISGNATPSKINTLLPTSKAVYDYVKASGVGQQIDITDLSLDISVLTSTTENPQVPSTKAIHDYINATTTGNYLCIYDGSELFPNSDAVYDYISAQGFLNDSSLCNILCSIGAQAGDITSLGDLIMEINNMLNKDTVYIFVRQDGIKAEDLGKNYLLFRSLLNGEANKPFKTLFWKNNPKDDPYLSSIVDYNCTKNSVIFIKTINDAIKIASNFKFLNQAELHIKVCSDLVWPYKISYAQNKTMISSIVYLNAEINHSDNCNIYIEGCELLSCDIYKEYKDATDDTPVSSYNMYANHIRLDNKLRTIYADRASVFVGNNNVLICDGNITIKDLIFDFGHNKENYNIPANTCINANNSTGRTIISQTAVTFAQYCALGHGIWFDGTFSGVGCTRIAQFNTGERSFINNAFEAISCASFPILVDDAGTLFRVKNSSGMMVLHSNYIDASDNRFFSQRGGSSTGFPIAIDINNQVYSSKAFVSVDSDNKFSKLISYNTAKDAISTTAATSLSTTLQLNPNMNVLVVVSSYNANNGITNKIVEFDYEKDDDTNIISVDDLDNHSKDYIRYINQNIYDNWKPSQKEGYTTNSFVGINLEPVMQCWANMISIDQYLQHNDDFIDKYLNPTTGTNQYSMLRLWDNPRYKSAIIPDNYLTCIISANNELETTVNTYKEPITTTANTAIEKHNYYPTSGHKPQDLVKDIAIVLSSDYLIEKVNYSFYGLYEEGSTYLTANNAVVDGKNQISSFSINYTNLSTIIEKGKRKFGWIDS